MIVVISLRFGYLISNYFNEMTLMTNKSSPESRAERVRRLRNMANLTRLSMCQTSDIKFDTLIGWEVARHGGLTEKGAIKVLNRVKAEGVSCSLEWLLHEIGAGPVVTTNFNEIRDGFTKKTLISTNEAHQITKELLFFRDNNENSIELCVTEDGMAPVYNPGDYVAGVKWFQDKLPSLIGLDCIVQPLEGELVLRRILAGDEENQFNLVCTNINTRTRQIMLMNQSLIFAAPILWHRKRSPGF